MPKQAHVFVYGDVIGVGFRAWTKILAKSLGIKGWVKNNYDKNCVEALLQAEKDTLDQMISRLKQGAPVSEVDEVEVKWQIPGQVYPDFSILIE